jgi:hypothetical protein
LVEFVTSCATTTTYQQFLSDHLYALLTSIKDYAEDWDSVLTDDEYIKLKQAYPEDAKVVKELQDKIDNADQTVQSFRKNPQGGAQLEAGD